MQATVLTDHCAYVAYELNSQYWRRGIGSQAVHALLEEHLRHMHELSPPERVQSLDVSRLKAVETTFWTVRDTAQSFGNVKLLHRLGFEPIECRHVECQGQPRWERVHAVPA